MKSHKTKIIVKKLYFYLTKFNCYKHVTGFRCRIRVINLEVALYIFFPVWLHKALPYIS